jgi:hypothetical protein
MIKSKKSNYPVYFRIKLKSHLEYKWSDWFDDMVISHEGALTILTGKLEDQAALHGILNRIRDLNLTLLAVEQIDFDPEDKK